ncbi:ISL3 family transposase [Limosilactobacillus fastidiosus]|uniref:ISL3 family transposase n=4 Tax=Limosilactobacillus fastidiosus TaxID=2759855 RepID=A0ABR6E873_9LACO|nr:ISL3 family transposase [Limosilactobacillus fastidiosus]MBB1062808.1 ISL3 family transposase [Limosilactobacillus fastidiosus]MBB1063261.1 ISL3 family transposase [Limosilactobacillus fastidiosus]MBB1063297.1 ISL3 family transposase [Limosilactobacillus fastidiosus]MBB1063338.1 ISL3 family transposase [Limosilactobacillus fastidiosus]MCD7084533.1 ISL3 family transposase [Limosilactobacillus fastidiosus]
MSLNNSILNLLGIEDRNIKVLNVETTSKNNEQLKVIHASLSYPVARCKNCGFETVVKNGFRKTHLRLASLNGMRYEMILAKQRYYCSNCQTTFGATTDLTKPNQTLTRKLKSQIMLFVHEGMNGELIARLCHCSPSSVRRTTIERVKPHYRMAVLPKHLCFDEFRSTKSIMSFICCDSESHQLVVKLHNRLSPSIIDYFENRYSQAERARVESVVIDLNAQYQSFIYRLFPNAQIIIDRFHIVQLAGRALDNCRLNILKFLDKHSREYKIMKNQWRLFHLKQTELHPEKPVYLRGINEYMTKQNAVDLITSKFTDFKVVYQTYQAITQALQERDPKLLQAVLQNYQTTNTEMDTTIRTFRKNQQAVINSTKYEFSNGPLEGINRKIKTLKRTCYGFANQNFFFLRIDCLFA